MDIWIVIKYDSLFDGEEIAAIFNCKQLAEIYKENTGSMRVEQHKILYNLPPGARKKVKFQKIVRS